MVVDPPLSLRAYAKRRGCNAMAVSVAVKVGRLKASVVRDENGQPKIADPELADQEWEANTDHSKRLAAEYHKAPKEPPSGAASNTAIAPTMAVRTAPEGDPSAHEGLTQSEASAIEKVWKAKLAEQTFRERAGELVEASEVEQNIAEVFSEVRTKLLGLPTRLRQEAPHVAETDVTLVESLIREALSALAAGAEAEEIAE